jgi:hypothetical protein
MVRLVTDTTVQIEMLDTLVPTPPDAGSRARRRRPEETAYPPGAAGSAPRARTVDQSTVAEPTLALAPAPSALIRRPPFLSHHRPVKGAFPNAFGREG